MTLFENASSLSECNMLYTFLFIVQVSLDNSKKLCSIVYLSEYLYS